MDMTIKEYFELYRHPEDDVKQQQARIFNKELIGKYPWLALREYIGDFPNGSYVIPEDYDYTYTWFDSLDKGWAIAFGLDMCQEIQEDLEKNDFVDNFSPMQIKEKYGGLRFYTSGIPMKSKIHQIISKYEHLSEETCVKCGQPAKWYSLGWICPYCDACKEELESKIQFEELKDDEGEYT